MTHSIAAAARDRPSDVALVIGREVLDHRALSELAAKARVWLGQEGARPGSTLALVGRSSRGTVAMLLAAFDAGVVPVLLHPRWTPRETDAAIAVVRPDRVAPVAEPWLAIAPPPDPPPPVSPEPESPLAVLFTSGTTGAPRGVVLSRRAFDASARASAENLGWCDDDRWLLALPLAHVGGLSILTRCLTARAAVVLPPELEHTGKLTLEATVASVERDRVTLLSVVPTQLARLLDAQWTPPLWLRAILVGGAAASPSLLGRAADRGWPVLTTYGLTEACSQVTTQERGTANRGQLGAGRPLAGVEIRVDDGRIRVRGPTLLSRCIPEEPYLDAEGWLETGDHGALDEAGNLHVLGRGRDLIVTGGENVHPVEVERCLTTYPGVRDACAFGVPHEDWGHVVAAALVVSETFDARELQTHLATQLAPFKQPRLVARLEALPTTRAGKLDRAATALAAEAHLGRLT